MFLYIINKTVPVPPFEYKTAKIETYTETETHSLIFCVASFRSTFELIVILYFVFLLYWFFFIIAYAFLFTVYIHYLNTYLSIEVHQRVVTLFVINVCLVGFLMAKFEPSTGIQFE